uniref:Mitogen-activated protein kinase kinase kinase n=1 Tax=Globodera rostochiensis TaxID=31243 RepID=A0A914HJD9_GLORO
MCSPPKDVLKSNERNKKEAALGSAVPSVPSSQHCCPNSPSTSSGSSSPSSTECHHQLSGYPLILRDQLEVGEQLGAGTYGSVFRGRWAKAGGVGKIVAMKKVFLLDKEVEILSQIRHRNIIQFYGVSMANPDFWIVTEYAENGSLFENLHNKEQPLKLERIIKWAVQIARGVVYLHHEAPLTVIHRDLKSKNIVIDSRNQCKLCDFGASKDLTRSWTSPSWGGTAAWMSPEIISQRPEGITTKSDVWSFSVVLWEILSREIPYNGLTEFKIYSIISQHGVRLVIPDTCPSQLNDLLQSCWRTEPVERPDMRCVLAVLQQIGNDSDLQREVAQFLAFRKDEWRDMIREQTNSLEELKLDLARQMEDLRRREAIVRKRENSHRNFLHMVDMMNVEDVCEWNEDCVCEWVQNIAASAMEDFGEAIVDQLVSCILQYEINGCRLLKITEKDLECLGIESVAVRRYIGLKLDELRTMNVQLCNFGCPSAASVGCEQSNSTPVEQPILLHVGLYSRIVSRPEGPAYRFKVFLDSDWEASATATTKNAGDEGPKNSGTELPDSSFLIKEVNISMTSNRTPLREPVQCICPPFGYLEWAQIDASDRRRLPVTVTVTVTYTDQVIHPRNTRIQIQLDALPDGPRTLCNKRVTLKINGLSSDTCLSSRISSQMLLKSPPPSMQALRMHRRRSADLSGSVSPSSGRTMSSSSLLNRSPIWADLAATIRHPTVCAVRPLPKAISLERSVSGVGEHLQRSTSSEAKTNDRGAKYAGNEEEASVDLLQRSRQSAFARIHKEKQQKCCVRKKCASENEFVGGEQQQQKQQQQKDSTCFYLSQQSASSSSTSPSQDSSGSEGPLAAGPDCLAANPKEVTGRVSGGVVQGRRIVKAAFPTKPSDSVQIN